MSLADGSCVVTTCVTRDRLAHTRVLAESLRRHHPGVVVHALVLDGEDPADFPDDDGLETLGLDDLPDAGLLNRMAFRYEKFEFCVATKPFLLEGILARHPGVDRVLYLDSDILVLAPFDDLLESVDHSVVLTPHTTRPSPGGWDRGGFPVEEIVLRSGLYNGGFVAVDRNEPSVRFLGWWKRRLVDGSRMGEPGFSGDQMWLNFAPLFFDDVGLLEQPGANVGHWRLHEGAIEKRDDGFTFGGQPLYFFHFSGWRIDRWREVSRHASWVGERDDDWILLARAYRDRLRAHDHEATLRRPYGLGTFRDGRRIDPWMRRAYRRMSREGRWPGGSPFERPDLFHGLRNLRWRYLLEEIRRRMAR